MDRQQVEEAMSAALIKCQACCLDDEIDFQRVLSSVVDTVLTLITLDRGAAVMIKQDQGDQHG